MEHHRKEPCNTRTLATSPPYPHRIYNLFSLRIDRAFLRSVSIVQLSPVHARHRPPRVGEGVSVSDVHLGEQHSGLFFFVRLCSALPARGCEY